MTRRRFTKPLGAAIGSLAIGAAASAQDFKVTGEISGYALSANVAETDLVPDPTGSGYGSDDAGASAVLRAQFSKGDLTLKGQFRLDVNDGEMTGTVDEAYAEYAVAGGKGFLFAGRRILSYGQSYGLNPADIFADPLQQNRVYASSKASNDVVGVDMIGSEWFFENGGSLSAMYAPEFDQRGDDTPEEFGLIRYTGIGAGGALDYALSAMSGDRPGVGVSATYGIGDASVMYLDATVRRGREKQTVTGLVGDQLITADADADAIAPFVTLGYGHTFANGVSLNAEYTHDGGGYSDAEWAEISSALGALTPVTSALAGQSLGQLNGVLDHYTLRQNYAFMRVAQDGVFGSAINAEFTVLHSLDDGSGSAGVRVERGFGESLTLGAVLSQTYGDTNSEFTLRPKTGSVAIYTTMRF